MASPLTISLKVVGLEQAKADLKDFGTIGQRSFTDIQAEAQKISAAMGTTDKAMSGLANRMRRLAGEIDPLAAANINLRNAITDVERALQKDIISKEQSGQMTEHLRRLHEQLTSELVNTAEASLRVATNIGALTAKFDPATASAARMAAELAELNQAQRAGVNIAGGYEAAWDGIIAKYDEGAVAAKRAAAAQKELIDGARAAQNALTSQTSFNTQLGVDRPRSSSARESASVFEELFAAEKEAESAAVALAATVASLTAKFDPAAASAQAMAAEIAELNRAARLGVEIAGGYQAAWDGIIAKYDEGAQAANRAAIAIEKLKQEQLESNAAADAARVQTGLNQSLGVGRAAGGSSAADAAATFEKAFAAAEKYKDALQPLAALERQREVEIGRINELNKASLLTDTEKDASVQRTNKIYDEQAKLIQHNAGQSVASTAQVRFAVQNLGFQINDVFTQLSSGASPLTVLIQQAGQFQQAFATGGGVSNTIKEFAKSVANAITPVTLLVTATVALGAAFVVLVNRAFQNAEQIRRFDLILAAFATNSAQTAENLQKISGSLQAQGVAAEDADKALQALGRNRLLNPAAIATISQSGLDLAARLGIKDVEGINKWTQAVQGGIDAIIKLGLETNTLSTADAVSVRRMADQGKQLEARHEALQKMSAALRAAHDAVLSPTAKAINSIGEAWNKMLEDFSKLGPIQNAKDALVNMLLSVANAASGTTAAGTPAAPVNAIPGTNLRTGAPGYIPGSSGVAEGLFRDLWTWIKGNPNPPVSYAGAPGDMRVTTYGYGSVLRAPASAGIGAVDPRILEAFALTQQLTGIQAQVTPHGGTTGGHVAGSQHYPRNTLTGYGEALDFNVADTSGRMILASEAAPGTKGRDLYEYFANYMKGLLQQGYGVGRSALDFRTGAHVGHVDAQGMPPMGATLPGVSRDLIGPGGVVPTWMPGGSTQAATDAEQVFKAQVALERYTQATKENLAVKREWGTEEKVASAILEARRAALTDGETAEQANSKAVAAGVRARGELSIEIQKNTVIQTTQTKAYLDTTEALKINEAAANQVTAAYQAQNEVLTGKIRLEDKAARIQQILAEQAAKNAVELQRSVNANDRRIEVLQLENQLSGATAETIATQVSLLQAKQKLQEMGVDLTSKEGQNYLKSAEALAKAVEQHAAIAREQQKQDDMWRKIGGTIESAVGDVIDGIFDPKKAIDWGKQIKGMMQGLVKDLAMSQFVRPMIGNLLGTFGASANVVQGFGGTGGGGTNISIGGGMFGGGGLFKELGIDTGGSGSGGGLFSGVSNFFNEGLGGVFGRSVPDFGGGGELGIAAGTGESAIIPGSVFGGTTLGSAIGGVGLGFGAGTMLNSLVGGKSTGGMLGSGVGALGGMALGSLIGMPWLGGLLGGAGGGLLGGMFGNNRPSNQSAGANIDLSTFKITSGFAGGNQQIDQQMAQMGQSLQGFLDLLKTTGGALSGNVLLQSGVNTGITVDSSLEKYAGRYELGKDSDAALKVIEQALIKSITGVSETMTTVLAQVGTDEDIAHAIAFANAYDKISEAAEDAFKSVESTTKQIGPFAIAMNQITTIFTDMTTTATRFGLALEPINAGLAEATKRLQGDFGTALDTAMNSATGKDYRNQIQTIVDDYHASLNEALAIGLTDRATNDRIGQVFTAQINEVLSGLTPEELADVATLQFTDFNEVIDNLARSASGASTAVADLANRLQSALSNIQDYIDQIRAVPGGTVSPESALRDSQAQFVAILQKAQGGDIGALEGITGKADQYIKAILAYYGSSQAGAGLTDQILKDLEGLLGLKEVHEDPAILTNTILTQQTQLAQDQINATLANTTALTASNDAMAKALIAVNDAATAALIATTNKTAEDNIKSNFDLTAKQIEEAQARTNEIITQADTQKVALVDANAASAQRIVEQNAADAVNLIQNTDDATTSIIDQGNVNSGALISSGQLSTAQILGQASLGAAQATADAKASTDAIVAQNEADKLALISAGDATTKQLLDSAGDSTAQAMEAARANKDSVAGWGEATVYTVAAWGGATVNTIAEWSKNLVTASFDGATSVANTVTAWGGATTATTGIWGKAIVDTIAAWAPLQLAQINDSAANIINTIALWGGAVITSATNLTNSLIQTDTGLANSMISAAFNGAETVSRVLAQWFTTEIDHDTTMTNSLINVGATYSNAGVIATYGAANSLISAEAAYSNNLIVAIQNQHQMQIDWYSRMNNGIYGIYNSSEQGNWTLVEIRNSIRDLLSQFQLLANQPPHWEER